MYFSPGGEFFKTKNLRMVLWASLAIQAMLLVPSVTAAGEGTECWGDCNEQDGPCVTGFCGEHGHCCRVGYPGCGAERGCPNFHCCVNMGPTVNIVDDGSETPSGSVDQSVEVDAEGNTHSSSGLLATITVQVTKASNEGEPVMSRTK